MHTAASPTPPLTGRDAAESGAGPIRFLHPDPGAVIKLCLSGNDDALARFNAGNNFLPIVDDAAHLDLARSSDSVLHDEHLADADEIHDGIERHDGGWNISLQDQFATRKCVRPQFALLVLHQRARSEEHTS